MTGGVEALAVSLVADGIYDDLAFNVLYDTVFDLMPMIGVYYCKVSNSWLVVQSPICIEELYQAATAKVPPACELVDDGEIPGGSRLDWMLFRCPEPDDLPAAYPLRVIS